MNTNTNTNKRSSKLFDSDGNQNSMIPSAIKLMKNVDVACLEKTGGDVSELLVWYVQP